MDPDQSAGRSAAAAAAECAAAAGQLEPTAKCSRCASAWSNIAPMPVCAGCHRQMDPIGFALENFDGIGHWRTTDDGARIDPSGTLFNGANLDGVVGLRQALVARPEIFVGVMTEKMLTYALGRGLEYYDMPAVRKIVQDAKGQDFRFSSIVLGIAQERAVSDEGGEVSVYHQKAPFSPNVSPRRGRDALAAAARLDGAGPDAAGEDRRQSAGAPGILLHAPRRGDGELDAGRGRAAEALADPGAAGAVQGSGRGRQQPGPRAWPARKVPATTAATTHAALPCS